MKAQGNFRDGAHATLSSECLVLLCRSFIPFLPTAARPVVMLVALVSGNLTQFDRLQALQDAHTHSTHNTNARTYPTNGSQTSSKRTSA